MSYAIQYKKHFQEAYFSKAACLMQLGHYEESISECNKAMECKSSASVQISTSLAYNPHMILYHFKALNQQAKGFGFYWADIFAILKQIDNECQEVMISLN